MLEKFYSKFQRVTSNRLYIPELDGIRTFGLFMVICFHGYAYYRNKASAPFAEDMSSFAWLDQLMVNFHIALPIFFMLSAFILSIPFANQYINGGKKTDIKKYYLRRLTRVEPPYFTVIILLFVLLLATKTHMTIGGNIFNPNHYFSGPITFSELWPSFLASLCYVHLIVMQHAPYLTVVAWSLEVEIQYYCSGPLLFKIYTLKKYTRRIIMILATIAIVLLHDIYQPKTETIYWFFQFFIMGIFLADLYVTDVGTKTFKNNWILVPFLIALGGILYLPKYTQILQTEKLFASIPLPFLIAFFIFTSIKNPFIKKLFSNKIMTIIGGMGYSIYLLHYPVISFVGHFTTSIRITNHFLPNAIFHLLVVMASVFPVAAVFFLYVEKPFMASKWVEKLGKKKEKAAVVE